jgi:DNA-binding PucR family transcriptional regulator
MTVESTLGTRFDELTASLAARSDELADEYVRRASVQIPEWTVERPDLAETIRTGARRSMGTELRALANGALPPETCPEVDADGARYSARLGVPLHFVLQQYRMGHAIQWEAWFELVEEAEPDPDARRALLERGSRFFFDYADRMCRFATEHYTEERERTLRSAEQRRVHLVRDVLDGREVDPDALAYELDGVEHVGLIAWGPEAVDAVRELARSLGRRALVVSAAEETWWAWLGARSGGADRDRLDRTLSRLRPRAGVRLAIGAPAAGLDGFRRTHRQATAAQRAALQHDDPVVRFDDVALESLASADPAAAREFAAMELRGIDGDDVRSTKLRETLGAWFACGQNAAATAARLSVHEQTVAQRLRAVEERIGKPVASRRAELETALRLRDYA